MKFAIVTHNLKKGDGQGRVNYEIVQEAIRRNHHVYLVADDVAPELSEYSNVTWIRVKKGHSPTQLLRNLVFDYRSRQWLRVHHAQLDAVLTNGSCSDVAADINVVHFVHHAWLKSSAHISRHHRNLYGVYQWLYSYLSAQREEHLIPKSCAVVAVSQKVKDELIAIGIPSTKVSVTLNGVDLAEFHPGSVERFGLGLPENVVLGLFVGDIRSTRKNLDTVLKAMVKLPDMHLAVVGNEVGSPYPSLAAQLGIADRVYFLGYRRDVATLMRAADLFVFPSRYEACTLALIEALASGLPVVTATSTGGSEMVTSDCGVVLQDSEDQQALVNALSCLIQDKTLRQSMSISARHVAEMYGWQKQASHYVDALEKFALTRLRPRPEKITRHVAL